MTYRRLLTTRLVPILATFTAGYLVGATWRYAEHRALRRQLVTIRHAATHDELTGLLNRTGLYTDGAALVLTARQPVSVMVIDVDDFKPINDACGHQTGDAVLAAIARRIQTPARPHGLAARLGGDEFALILVGPDAVTTAKAWALAEDVTSPIQVAGRVFTISASTGIAHRQTGDTAMLDELLSRADTAMYRAKRDQTRLAVYDPTIDPAHPGERTTHRTRDQNRPTRRPVRAAPLPCQITAAGQPAPGRGEGHGA